MKRIIRRLFSFLARALPGLALCGHAWAAEPLAAGAALAATGVATNLWFPLGEGMEYRAYWGVIPVAYALVTNELVEVDGQTRLAIRIQTRSNDFLSKIYPVDDFLESIVDLDTFLPIRFTKKLREGRYWTHEETTFDHAAGKAYWKSHKSGNEKVLDIEPDTRDLISFMYFMRPKRLFEPGEHMKFRVMADEKIYDLEVRAEKKEKFRVSDFGWIESVKVEPVAEFGGLFVRHKGRAWMWVSLDPRRLITKISVRIPIANVHVLIHSVTGPGDDFWVKGVPPKDED